LGAFHWNGEFSTFGEFIDQIMTERMGLGMRLSDENQAALLSFLDDIPAPVRKPAQDPGAAARGEELFFSERAECGKCHQGELLTDNRLHDVGTGGNFVTPPLIGVGVRSPLMHDGCASDLRARFGVCGGGDLHGKTSELSVGELDDLLVYMEGL
jgi:CxxC motif-containing protein (DUF1111 family)